MQRSTHYRHDQKGSFHVSCNDFVILLFWCHGVYASQQDELSRAMLMLLNIASWTPVCSATSDKVSLCVSAQCSNHCSSV